MIVHGVVLHANRAPLVATHPAADLTAPRRGTCFGREVALDLAESVANHLQRDSAVLPLGPLTLAAHSDARGQVEQLNGAVGLLQMLAALSGRTAHRPLEIFLSDHKLVLLGLVENRDRDRARLHATAFLGRGYSLVSMPSGLALEQRASTPASHVRDHEPRAALDDSDAKATSGLRVARRWRVALRPGAWHPLHPQRRGSR